MPRAGCASFDPRGILSLVIGEGLRVLVAGVAAGAAGAWLLGRAMRHALYGVGAADPVLLAAAAGVVTAAGLAACWLPARRAARVDPAVALRAE